MITRSAPLKLSAAVRSPIERAALKIDVAECDFKRACQLLGLYPADMLKERLRSMSENEFAEFCRGRAPPPKQDTACAVFSSILASLDSRDVLEEARTLEAELRQRKSRIWLSLNIS